MKRLESRSGLAAALAAGLFVLGGGCASESTTGPETAAVTATQPTSGDNAAAGPSALAEMPEKRNERLLRLEWACDQWWAATNAQEYEKQASMESLLHTYVTDHFAEIVSDLRAGTPRHRRTMVMALGFSQRQDAVPVIEESLKDQYYEVVLHGLLALYHLAKTDPVPLKGSSAPPAPRVEVNPEIVVPYLRHPRPEVRSNAALVLAHTLKPGTSKSLILVVVAAVEDQDPATRVHAVAALGATGDREVFPYLVKALRDPVQLVRVRAALSLGRLADPDAVPYLITTLADKSEKIDVQRAAAKSLGELLGTKEIDSLDPKVWEDAAKSMKLLPADSKSAGR